MGSAVPFTPFRGPNDLTLGVRRGGFDLSFRFLGFPGHGRRGLWRGGQRCRLVHDRPALIAEVIRRRVGRVEIFRSGRWLGNCQRRRAQERRRRCDKDAARPFHNTGMLARHTGVLGAARARRELRWLALREVHHREGAFGPSSLLVVLGRLRFLRLRICARKALKKERDQHVQRLAQLIQAAGADSAPDALGSPEDQATKRVYVERFKEPRQILGRHGR
jgi:hypothetical protein